MLGEVDPMPLEAGLHQRPVVAQLEVGAGGQRQQRRRARLLRSAPSLLLLALDGRGGGLRVRESQVRAPHTNEGRSVSTPVWVRGAGLLAVGGSHLRGAGAPGDSEDHFGCLLRRPARSRLRRGGAARHGVQRHGEVHEAPLDGESQVAGLDLLGVLRPQELQRLLQRAHQGAAAGRRRRRIAGVSPEVRRSIGRRLPDQAPSLLGLLGVVAHHAADGPRHVLDEQGFVERVDDLGEEDVLEPLGGDDIYTAGVEELDMLPQGLKVVVGQVRRRDGKRRGLPRARGPPAQRVQGVDDHDLLVDGRSQDPRGYPLQHLAAV
mmetsp:Transcript_147241/g.455461  ORF Transcript_147241/g.455461 Transcript_147241/m.455461 type:complete len:320 (-) Transcript_147241:102-1061(-)